MSMDWEFKWGHPSRSSDVRQEISSHGAPVTTGGSKRKNGEEKATPGSEGQAVPRLLDGNAIAASIKAEVAEQVMELAAEGIRPGLAVVLVGSVPASQIYVRNKVRTCGQMGIYSELITRPESIATEELLQLVTELNVRDDVDGILVQMPLPKHVNSKLLMEAILPEKDIDGLHPMNAGKLQTGRPALVPCTPAGVIEILKRSGIPVAGQNAVVVGRSDLAGKPAAMLLLQENATVTICHSKTRDLAWFTRNADILVPAIGVPGYITPEMVKPGSTIIDVGINRLSKDVEADREMFQRFFPGTFAEDAERRRAFDEKGSTIVGDVHPRAYDLAGAYTPVPGGAGALTIAMLMANTVRAAKLRRRIS